jgi:tetratricopeptide (TPR) repeat protein
VTTDDKEALRLFRAGRVQADRMHPLAARAEYGAALERDPDFALAWLQMSYVVPSIEESERCLAKAVALRDRVSAGERLLIDAAQAEQEGRTQQAREMRQKLVELHPDDPRVHYLDAMSYLMAEDEHAIAGLEKAVVLNPDLDVAWNTLGYAYARVGRTEDALAAHRKYVELLPDEPNAHDSYAETLLKAGHFEESIAEYDKALALDPSFVWSRMGIGHNLIFLGRFPEARVTYEEALSKAVSAQDRQRAAEWLVTLAVYANEPKTAVREAERVVEIARGIGPSEHAYAVVTLARARLVSGKAEDAAATAAGAQALLPMSAGGSARGNVRRAVLRMQIEAEIAQKNIEAADFLLKKLKEESAGESAPWVAWLLRFNEGYVLLAKGDAEGAAAALRTASLEDPRVLFHLAEAELALGHIAEAMALYRKVVRWNAPSMGHALVVGRAKVRLLTKH